MTSLRCGWAIAVMLGLAGCEGRVEPAPPAPAPTVTVPQPVVAESPPPVAQPLPPVPPPRAIEVPPPPGAACLANTAAAGPRARAMHRWVDAAGITHYSDQPPPPSVRDHRVIDVRDSAPIEVRATGYDSNLPDELQRRAVADALGVQRVLRDSLGVPPPSGIVLRVVFVSDAAAYGRLIGNPALAGSAGAYSTAQRTIFVRRQAQDEADFAVLRHEITHALAHESIGSLPTPINEGLAEYFGRYRVAGLGGQVDVGAGGAAIAAAAPGGDGAEALVDLLARDGDDFYASGAGDSAREARYLRAYALVAVLMRDAAGRKALSGLLARQREDACRPVEAERILDMGYPGGLSALARDWAGFMRAPPTDVRAY